MSREAAPLPAAGFTLESDALHLPKGAFAKTQRRVLRHEGRALLGFTQGPFRPYLYPVFTPLGFAVTSERPADHPHHNSLWIAADHVHALVPTDLGRHEAYTYNFYVDEVFQGRAPGRIVEDEIAGEAVGDACRIAQNLTWHGPVEWAAPDGRPIARERRTIEILPGARLHRIDIRSELTAPFADLSIGPTRHAGLSFRVAESMRASEGGVLVDSQGQRGGEAITGGTSRWIDFSGPVGGGHVAGITLLLPDEPGGHWVFATDWGVVTADPFRDEGRAIRLGEGLAQHYGLLVHDGDAEAADIEAEWREWRKDKGEDDAHSPL